MTRTIQLALLVLVLVVVAALAGYCRGQASMNRAAWDQARDSALGLERQAWQRQTEDLWRAGHEALRLADSAVLAAGLWQGEANALRHRRHRVPLPELAPASCGPWADRLSLCEQETQALRRTITADSTALGALRRVRVADSTRLVGDSARIVRLEGLVETAPTRRGLPKWLVASVGCSAGLAVARVGFGLEDADQLLASCGGGASAGLLFLPTK